MKALPKVKRSRGEATVERVLDAALAVFAGGRGEAVGVSAVSARSGVSVGSIYHHFGSMDGVSAALYRRCMGELLDAILGALPSPEAGPRGGVEAVVRSYLGWTVAHPIAARFIHASSYAGYVAAFADEIAVDKAARLDAILGWFGPFIATGQIVALPLPLYEMLIIGPVAELARRWVAGDTRLVPEVAMAVLPARIWHGLAPGSEGASRS